MQKPKRIVIAGPIGVGKTYACDIVEKETKYKEKGIIVFKEDPDGKNLIKQYNKGISWIELWLIAMVTPLPVILFISPMHPWSFIFMIFGVLSFWILISKKFANKQMRRNFRTQMGFFAGRLRTEIQSVQKSEARVVLYDRDIHEDHLFESTLSHFGGINKSDHLTYTALNQAVMMFIPEPDAIFYLKKTPAECLEGVRVRVAQRRARGESTQGEEGITLEYLTHLCWEYDEWAGMQKNVKIFTNTNDLMDEINKSLVL